MEDPLEQLGTLIDELDNLAHALNIPLPAEMHVEQLRLALPEKVERLKTVYVDITGENPWL